MKHPDSLCTEERRSLIAHRIMFAEVKKYIAQ